MPTGRFCGEPVLPIPETCTLASLGLPSGSQEAGGFQAGASGVVVSWKVRGGTSTTSYPIRLRLVRGTTGAGTGPTEILPPVAGIYSFSVRLPVMAGDKIAIDAVGVQFPGPTVLASAVGGSYGYWEPPLEDGESRGPSLGTNLELAVNVTIEPDADGDGYGDESQDRCPGSPATVAPCPVPPASPVPDTKIKAGPKGEIDKRKATFRFGSTVAGSTFRCKLDKKAWSVCKPPKIYRSLKEGSHTFRVRAVGPTGLVDPTPAKRSFKVEL